MALSFALTSLVTVMILASVVMVVWGGAFSDVYKRQQLFAEIDPETETFVEVGFRSHGCLAAIACATALATMLRGRTFDEACLLYTSRCV